MMKAFILSILTLLMISMDVVSDSGPVPFEFSKTVAIYHLMKDGGIIYTRPSEYNEAQGFIRVYEAMDQYLSELNNPSANSFFSHPEEQPILGEFLLVNGTTTKKYFLKDGWFGDGQQWVPMSQNDYARLTGMIAHRKELAGSNTTAEGLEDFTARIHGAAQENEILEFEKKFDHEDQEMEMMLLESDGKDSSSARNTSDMEEIIQDRGGIRSESANLTETGPDRIAKKRPISNDKEIIEKVELQNNPPVQEEGVQVIGPNYNWKGAAILTILIAGCFLYFKRKR